jgi:phenylacetate-CoA ligase
MSYQWLFKRLVFPLAEQFLGTSVQAKLAFLRQSEWWTPEELQSFRDERLREVVVHAYRHTHYYRDVFLERGIRPEDIRTATDLVKLPVLTKEIIKSRENDLRATSYAKKAFPVFTSGSTGSPTRFWQTADDYSWQWAAHFRAWEWAGYSLGERYAKLSINSDRHLIKKRIQDLLMNSLYICMYQMNPERIDGYIHQILSFQPKIVYGYSSSLTVLAQQMLRKGVRYKATAVITTGGNLIPIFRRDIEAAFNAKVYDDYGCGGEGLAIANQCSAGTYHINEEVLVTESVDNEAIVTSLNNYAMPLIRYRIGDRIALDKRGCSCGRALAVIGSIDGRSGDVVRTPRGDVLVVHFFSVFFTQMNGILKFKVIQDDPAGVTIRLVVNELYDRPHDEVRIRQYIEKSVGPEFRVVVEYAPDIPLEANGKYRLIEGMKSP